MNHDGNDDDDIDYANIQDDDPSPSNAFLQEAGRNDQEFQRAMYAMFGTTNHVVTKEDDTDKRQGDEKRFLPLNVPDGIDVREVRLEYELEEARSRLQQLASMVSLLLHVRHGDPMEEFFYKSEQQW